jgi:hypothetical protein
MEEFAEKQKPTGFSRIAAEVVGEKGEKFLLDIKPHFWPPSLG